MSRFENLIPFILHFECGVGKEFLGLPLARIFEEARKKGYAYDPADAGGHTMCGITLATYRQYRKGATVDDLKAMPFDDWVRILKAMFWDRWHADSIVDQSVANMVVDWLWHAGSYGITRPQRLLGVKPDGIVGPLTLGALNAKEPRQLFDKLKADRHLYYEQIIANSVAKYAKKIGRQPTEAEMLKHTNYRFRKGWRRRNNAIIYGGFDYEATW